MRAKVIRENLWFVAGCLLAWIELIAIYTTRGSPWWSAFGGSGSVLLLRVCQNQNGRA
jgi:hypothetical protein